MEKNENISQNYSVFFLIDITSFASLRQNMRLGQISLRRSLPINKKYFSVQMSLQEILAPNPRFGAGLPKKRDTFCNWDVSGVILIGSRCSWAFLIPTFTLVSRTIKNFEDWLNITRDIDKTVKSFFESGSGSD